MRTALAFLLILCAACGQNEPDPVPIPLYGPAGEYAETDEEEEPEPFDKLEELYVQALETRVLAYQLEALLLASDAAQARSSASWYAEEGRNDIAGGLRGIAGLFERDSQATLDSADAGGALLRKLGLAYRQEELLLADSKAQALDTAVVVGKLAQQLAREGTSFCEQAEMARYGGNFRSRAEGVRTKATHPISWDTREVGYMLAEAYDNLEEVLELLPKECDKDE